MYFSECLPIFYKNNHQYIGHEVKIQVPDGFFKVVLSLKKGKEKAIGFIYQNSNNRQTMEDTAVSVDEVEKLTGYDFFSILDDVIENKLEAECNLKQWN